ncbi:MAG: PAS domain S-box protein [Chlorobium sp.]
MQHKKIDKITEVSLSDFKLSTEHEQAFRNAIIDAIPGTFYLLDSHVRLVGWNAYLRDEIIGKPESEMASTNALEFIHPDDRHIIRRKMLNVLNHGMEESAEVRVFLRGGSEIRWRLMTGKRIMLDGNPFLIGMGIDITERKRAEESLRESEEQLRELFDNMLNGCVYGRIIFEEGRPVDFIHEKVNSGFEKLTGLKNVVGRKMSEVMPGIHESTPEFFERFARIALTGNSDRFEIFLDSLNEWFDISAYSIKEGYFVAVIDVITERKQSEQRLQENEERFRKLFESPSAVKILLEPDTGNIIDANQTAADFYGWSIEELKQMRIQQINTLPPDVVKSTLQKSKSSDQNLLSFRHRKADGSIRDVEVFVNTIKITGKAFLYAIIQDITQRKRFEALSAMRLRMLDMANICPVEELMQITLDEAEKLTESSLGFVQFLDRDPTSPSLQIWSTNAIKSMCQSEQKEWRYPMNETGVWADALREQRAVIQNDYTSIPVGHPEIRHELVVPVIRANTVMAILGVANKLCPYTEEDSWFLSALFDIAWDIVARKRAEQSEQDMQAILTQSQKMELVGQLAGGIAHDFNNMLGIILGNIEMAMEQQDLDETLQINLKYILKAANRSADLTRQLLAFARKQTVMPIVLELNTMVESILAILRRLIGENITIVWIPDSHQSRSLSDRPDSCQPLHQRPRCHIRYRQNHHRNRQALHQQNEQHTPQPLQSAR